MRFKPWSGSMPHARRMYRALLLLQHDDLDGAKDACAAVLQRDPNHIEARYTLAIVAFLANHLPEALALMLQVVGRAPRWPPAVYNAGYFFQLLGFPDKAIQMYQHCLMVDPTFVSAQTNLGNAYLDIGDPDRAMECYRKALDARPDEPEAQYNQAHALLLLGDWARGWAQQETRWQQPTYRARHESAPGLPVWSGDDLTGKTILVQAEQGVGDTLMMLRFVPGLVSRFHADRVLIRVRPDLVRLVADTFGDDDVVSEADPVPDADCVVYVMSFPHRFGTTPDTVPPTPYLATTVRLADREPTTIGFAWRGSPDHKNDRNRSTALTDGWERLIALPGTRWRVLQGITTDDEDRILTDWATRYGTLCPPERHTDWKDTADRICQDVRRVVCVDTGLGHLAGALGVPVDLLVPAQPDFRWQLKTSTSVWYGGHTLHRQDRRGDWGPVFDRLADQYREGV